MGLEEVLASTTNELGSIAAEMRETLDRWEKEMTFSEWLESTVELQATTFGIVYPLEGEALADHSTWNLFALASEVAEIGGEIGWKPWASDRGWVNREGVILECVDAMHFIANVLCSIDATGEEVTAVYRAKQQKNRDRQAAPDGYITESKTDYIR